MELHPQVNNELSNFIDFLYDGLEGFAYVATKDPNDPYVWEQHYFQYPAESSRMESVIHQASSSKEVYIAPALYKTNDYRRENFKVSNVVWTEFDGNAPTEAGYDNPPSLKVQTSESGNQHVYWRLDAPITDVNRLEEINRNITYAFSADSSAWDATQVLRPPGTRNYKYSEQGHQVFVADSTVNVYSESVFDTLPEAPAPIDVEGWEPSVLPDVAKVILKYAFPTDIANLFSKSKLPQGERSTGLMNLAYACCEMGMKDAEIFAVLLNADDRWGKFRDRKDRNKRLAHIITVARHKHPDESPSDDVALVFDFIQFLNTDIELDWVIDGMLMEGGSMLMVGPSGIGKTQLSYRAAMHLALGKEFLGHKIERAQKVLFLSLEMGHGELKKVTETMIKDLSANDLEGLQKNLVIVPHGEKWALNTPVGQEKFLRLIEEVQPNGILIDSIGAAMKGNISSDDDVMPLVDFNYAVRKKFDIFLWYIHHMRKSNNGGGQPSSQDDVYGNQYFVNSATSAYGLLPSKGGLIKLRNFKNRMAEKEDDHFLRRTEYLNFESVNKEVDKNFQHLTYKQPEEDKGPAPDGKGEKFGL